MFKSFGFLIALTALSAVAGTHRASISHIDYPVQGEKETLLYLSDATVIRLSDQKDISFYEDAKNEGRLLKFKTDSNRYLLDAEELPFTPSPGNVKEIPEDVFTPTILNSPVEAATIFKNLRRNATSSSQCYNRAHIWSYESKNKFQLNSMKVFMFYTRKYIREYNFQWWFHVAPFTYVMNDGVKRETVLDPRFTKVPTEMKAWTDEFMKNKVTCPVISKYSDYANHQEDEYCYLYKTSMFYVQPLDLENLENTGKTKNTWLDYEIKRAYRNGFRMWW